MKNLKRLLKLFDTNRYFVTKEGHVFSRLTNRGNVKDKLRLKTSFKRKDGYRQIAFRCLSGSDFLMYHHQVTWAYFKRKIGSNTEINHIDGDKDNNSIENLEEVTAKQNQAHATRLGLRANMPKGEAIRNSKLKSKDVFEIRKQLKSGLKQKEIARNFNVGQMTISRINTRKTWRHL